jgi:hypothetical protein
MRTLTNCLILLAVLLAPQTLWAFSVGVPQAGSHNFLHWTQTSVNYYLNPLGGPGSTPDVANGQLQLGFQGWMDVACGNLQFVLNHHCSAAGTCTYDTGQSCTSDVDCPSAKNLKLTPLGTTNSRNELGFITTNAWTFGAYVLGVTSPSFDPSSGKIYEADIAFNGYYYNWVADFAAAGPWNQTPTPNAKTKMHILSVAIHEEGHFFGAQHVLKNYSASDPPTMAPQVDPYGATATLTADDSKLICFLNPKAAYTCASDADCPYINSTDSSGQEYYAAKMSCDTGTSKCSWTPGTTTTTGGKLGAVCSLDTDCASPLFCQPVDATSYCSQLCQTASPNCGTGFDCIGYQNGNGQGACVPKSGGSTGPTANVGDACAVTTDCITGTCFNKICHVACTTANPTQCSATEDCQSTGTTGKGVCVPGSGKKAIGGACAAASDCISSACIGGTCRAKCVNKTDCPSGQGCTLQPEGYSACVPGTGGKLPVGSQCTATTDCSTGLACEKLNAGDALSWCRMVCTTQAECGGTDVCATQADGSLACIPAVANKKGLGDACDSSDSCDSGLCVAGLSKQSCTQVCTVGDSTTCPCGFECLNTTAGGLCFAGKKVACIPAGSACTATSECAGGNCIAGKCVGGKQPDPVGGTTGEGGACVVTAVPSTCAVGLSCQRTAPDSTSGICHAASGKGAYEPCTSDAECASLFCAIDVTANGATRCQTPCDPSHSQCGDGMGCAAVNTQIGGCYILAAVTGSTGSASDGGSGTSSGCSAATTGTASAFLACFAACGLVLWRRRRS